MTQISVTFMSGPFDGKVVHYDQPAPGQARELTIGRRDSCDLALDYDSQVSRVHAKLGVQAHTMTGTDTNPAAALLSFWLEDAKSRNGTFLEKQDAPLEGRVDLRPGTLFRVGRTWLRLDVPFSFESDLPLDIPGSEPPDNIPF